MAYRTATVCCFDVMETVHIAATVKVWDEKGGGPATSEFSVVTGIQGVGSSEDHEWLRDALVGLIESL